jgi:hypothetical protein
LVSLEKSMFFVPNRLYVRGKEMFVSFNIAPIPGDINVTGMHMHVQVPVHSSSVSILVKEIGGGWDEGLMTTGYAPPHENIITHASYQPNDSECVIDLNAFAHRWRFDSLQNHGVYVKLLDQAGLVFTFEKPPFLVVVTD